MRSVGYRHRLSDAARSVTNFAGSWAASVLVVAAIAGWFVVGIFWSFDEPWHRWLHSGAAVITLLMLFVIQHTTNRETRAALVKLDELLRIHDDARNAMMSVERADPKEQDRIEEEMEDHPQSAPD